MKKKSLILFYALGLFTISACNKAKENIDLYIDASEIINYSVLLQVDDATGSVPKGLNIRIEGEDADFVYDIAGNNNTKLQVSNGLVTLGIHPKYEPQENDPINFDVVLSGEGYVANRYPVVIDKGQFNQVRELKIIKLSALPSGVTVKEQDVALTNNANPAPIIVTSPTTGTVTEATTVTVQASTQFRNANGVQLTGATLDLQVVNYSAKEAESVQYFPGGTLRADNVEQQNGQTGSVFFAPAGFTSVQMFIGNNSVKQFNVPIEIKMELDPGFTFSTGAVITTGSQLAVWSYSEDTGKWKFEGNSTVTMEGGKPVIRFNTNHLTVYAAAETVAAANYVSPVFTFNSLNNWLGNDSQPLTLEILNSQNKVLATQTIVVSNGLKYTMNGLSTVAVKYQVKNNAGEYLAEGNITGSGALIAVSLRAPSVPVTGVKLSLIVKCPNKGIITPPDFYLYYKITGTADTQYKLLGIVKKGNLSTTLLTLGQSYDFKAQWGNRDKIIKNYNINNSNLSTTVGVDDYLGSKLPDKNRQILIEECNKL